MIVLVTGASSGIGEAVARRFIRDGHSVVAAARREDRLEVLRAELGERLHVATLDVRDTDAVAGFLTTLPPTFANIDVLVNNAGLALGLGPAQQASLDDWDTMVATNVRGLMHLTRAVLPGMIERKRGHVIMIGSSAALWPYPGGNVYGATKAFVRQFALGLRADLHGTPVRVTDVEPGMVAGTEFSHVRFAGDTERVEKFYADATPLSADDVADAVAWVATRPAHVVINTMELMPIGQAFGPLAIARKPVG
jgi:3-hydroxy acid dehydrogenase / malonic semialdehyde reductase